MSFRIIYVAISCERRRRCASVSADLEGLHVHGEGEAGVSAKLRLHRQQQQKRLLSKPSGVAKTKRFKAIPAGSLKLFGFSQTAPEESEQSSEQQGG